MTASEARVRQAMDDWGDTGREMSDRKLAQEIHRYMEALDGRALSASSIRKHLVAIRREPPVQTASEDAYYAAGEAMARGFVAGLIKALGAAP